MSQGSQQLNRALGTLGTLFIVLSAITPASSVFIIVPGVINMSGSGALLSFAIAAVIGLAMAFVYAELSSAFPVTGGEYTMIGRTLGNLWGFVTLSLVFVSIILIVAVMALGIAGYLSVLWPNVNVLAAAIAAIILATVVAVLGIKANALVTGGFLIVELLALLVVAVLGFSNAARPLSELFTNPQVLDTASNVLAPAPWSIIFSATAVALFAYNGYGAAAYFGEETQNAKHSIARIVLWALVITVAAEIIPLAAVLVGVSDMKEFLAAPQKMEFFLDQKAGHSLTVAISLAVALAIFNAIIAIMLQAARLLFSSGRDVTWPTAMSHAVASVHPKFQSPWIATLVVAVLSAAACLIDLNLLLVVTGTSLVVVYALLCIAVIVGRQGGATSFGHYRMPFFPVPAVLALFALVYITYQNFLDTAFGRPSLIATLLIMLAGAVYYGLFLRRRSDWKLRGPDDI